MAASAPAAAPGMTAGGTAPGKAPVATAPFRAGTFRTLSSDGYQVSQALGTTAVQLTPYTPSPNSYLAGVWVKAVCTGANGGGSTVAFTGDGPFIAYASVTFQDANEKPIIGPFDGYTLFAINKFGGYGLRDPRANAAYSTTTGTGTTGGSFTFILFVPLQAVSRDTLGTLQNKASNSSFQLLLTVNTLANVYSTAPSASATLVTTCYEDGYVQPKPSDNSGTPLAQAPPQLGTTQYWTRGSYNGLNGAQQIQVTQGLGYPVRNVLGLSYDTSNSTRATGNTDFPTSLQFLYKGTSMFNIDKTLWQWLMSQWYGLSSATPDTANGLENGVFIWPFNLDFDNAPGAELRNALLGTQQGDQAQLLGTWNGSATLYWVANYMAPAAGADNVQSLRAGR